MTMNAKWEFSRREALLVAAGGVAAALTAPGAARADTATVSGLVFEDKDGSGKPEPGQSGPRRRARLQRQGHRGHRRRGSLHAAAARGSGDLRHQARGLHAAGRSRDQLAALLSLTSARGIARLAEPDIRRRAADGPAARLGRFRAAPAGRARRVRGRDVHRPAAGDPTSRSISSART